MASDEKKEGQCNARTSNSDGFCELRAGFGTDHVGEGRCKYHGGCAGAPEGNQNAVKHALYADRAKYYNALPAEEKAWVDELIKSMMDDAPFDRENFQKFQMVREIAIDMHKKRNANDYIAEEGIVQENLERDEEGNPITDEAGNLVTKTDENPVNLAYDRLDRTMTRKMKELGLLDDPESQKAEEMGSLAEHLSEMREEFDDN